MTLRVISGTAKGRRLRSVPGDTTRPVTDRVKEALFNILAGDVADSTWWDLFGGTGAIGIEALSRGAAFVRFTDIHRVPIETIKSNLAATKLGARAETRREDAFAGLRRDPDRAFDYIYIAPPQYQQLWSRALGELDRNRGWLAPDGWAILQIDPKESLPLELQSLEEFDRRKYGSTLLIFFRARQAG